MFGMIMRKKGMSSQQFHDHWRHPHGTLGAEISTLRRYVQSHQLHSPHLGSDQARYEGIAEVWFENEDDAVGFSSHPWWLRYIQPDEVNFLDLEAYGERQLFILMHEEVLVSHKVPEKVRTAEDEDDRALADEVWREHSNATKVKIVQIIEEDGDTPWASEQDADLGRQIGALRHVRYRPHESLNPTTPWIGIRELFWPTVTAFEEGIAAAPDAWDEFLSRPSQAVTSLFQVERYN